MINKILLAVLLGSTLLYSDLVRIMPFGDSITYENHHTDDAGPARPEGVRSAYRNYLWYKLSDANFEANFVGSQRAGQDIHPAFDPDNEGHPAWTSYELAESAYKWLTNADPDIILLHAGSNDWDESVSGIDDILDAVDVHEEKSGHTIKVFVALILDRVRHEEWIVSFNKNLRSLVNKRIANGDNLVLVDMYQGAGIDYSNDMTDNTHPNDRGYEKMANVWYSALLGKEAPTKMYSDLPVQEVESLYAYPTTIVDESYIIESSVDELNRVVVVTTTVPAHGIIF